MFPMPRFKGTNRPNLGQNLPAHYLYKLETALDTQNDIYELWQHLYPIITCVIFV